MHDDLLLVERLYMVSLNPAIILVLFSVYAQRR